VSSHGWAASDGQVGDEEDDIGDDVDDESVLADFGALKYNYLVRLQTENYFNFNSNIIFNEIFSNYLVTIEKKYLL
jgi:hypothetical protein